MALGLLAPSAALAAASDVTIEALFDYAAISQVKISPDGAHLAYIAPMNGKLGVALQPVNSDKADVLARSSQAHIDGFRWKGSENVIFFGDDGGTEAGIVRSINIKSRRVNRLNFISTFGGRNFGSGGIVSDLPGEPEHMILLSRLKAGTSNNVEDATGPVGYYRTNIRTGSQSSIKGYVESDIDVLWDPSGTIRARTILKDKKFVVQTRRTQRDDFIQAMEFEADWFVQPLVRPQFLSDNTTLYAIAQDGSHDRGVLVRVDPDTMKIAEVVFSPEKGEITSEIYSNDYSKLLGVRVEDAKEFAVWFDPTFKVLQATLDKLMPTTTNIISNWSNDQKRFVIASYSDVQPTVYFLFDLSGAKPRLMPIGNSRPAIDSSKMAKMEPISFKARDGLEIHGYLTRPAGSTGATPLIMMPHGGPYGIRDSWGFIPDVQFMASRGYSVLQVNYRGSGGYGLEFLEKGRFEWGAKMQDDKTDAVKWAIEQGYADPKRIGWFGGSYGGYAVLAAGVFTPEIVKCIVNIVGVSDMMELKRRGRDADTAYIYSETWLGDDERLKAISPLNHVEKLQAPSFHAYGLNDPRVVIDHWTKLEAELKRHNKRYEHIVEKYEGHGFQSVESRIPLYRKVEKFLEKNL